MRVRGKTTNTRGNSRAARDPTRPGLTVARSRGTVRFAELNENDYIDDSSGNYPGDQTDDAFIESNQININESSSNNNSSTNISISSSNINSSLNSSASNSINNQDNNLEISDTFHMNIDQLLILAKDKFKKYEDRFPKQKLMFNGVKKKYTAILNCYIYPKVIYLVISFKLIFFK
jgi:hypothetical protein